MERIIFHVDVNSAFLSWEATRRLRDAAERGDVDETGRPNVVDLREVPSIIGGNPERRTSIVTAKSIPAKKFGIVTGESVSAAVRKCPGLIIAKSDFALYSQCSKAFKSICREYTPVVEEFSIDECFLDMTSMGRLHPNPVKAAHELKDRIKDELGFTVNVGIAHNKLLAKMASDFTKPDRVHTLFQEEISEQLSLFGGQSAFAGENTFAEDAPDSEKDRSADKAVDALRERFGSDIIKRGGMINSGITPRKK